MEVFFGHRALPRRLRSSAVAIGNFDGVHRGHAQLFAEVRALADRAGGEAVALTFDPHPARVLAPAFAPPLITPLARKLELIEQAGIDVTVVEPFDRALADRTPEEFAEGVLVSGLGAKEVCVGYDFTFGKGRSGTVEGLRELGRSLGFSVTMVPAVTVEGLVCSSTKVREFVLEGRVDGARLILGRDPEVEGEVVRGEGRGRRIAIPTANVRPETELLPKLGVYAGWAERLKGPRARLLAAINIGTNPTFAGQRVTVEAHLLDFDEDLYGARLRLGFVSRLRDEQRFDTIEALIAQIRRDVEETRRRLAAPPNVHR